jgi:hypothetical protein
VRDNKQCRETASITTSTKAGRQQGKVQAIFMRQHTQTAGNGCSMAAMQQASNFHGSNAASNIHARLQQGASSKHAAIFMQTCREAERQRQHAAVAKRKRERGSTDQFQLPLWPRCSRRLVDAEPLPPRCRTPEVFSIHDTTYAENYWAGWA